MRLGRHNFTGPGSEKADLVAPFDFNVAVEDDGGRQIVTSTCDLDLTDYFAHESDSTVGVQWMVERASVSVNTETIPDQYGLFLRGPETDVHEISLEIVLLNLVRGAYDVPPELGRTQS